jgi:hypothetical protein
MRKYHVVLADQSERDILADALEVVEGALVFKDTYGEILVVYSPDTWILCEQERKDDK